MSYVDRMNKKIKLLQQRDDVVILAIESSCDETAASIVKGKEILSNVISSQVDIHEIFGGVVPEIASRNHTANIRGVVDKAIKDSSLSVKDIDIIAFTNSPGLLGALLVGVSYAKAMAYSLDIPFINVDHIKGHIAINILTEPELKFPFLALTASGGHTMITRVNDYDDFQVIGKSIDDAAGECFDKTARVLGLGYPGGPKIEKAAQTGIDNISFPTPLKNQKGYDFSFSGLKTSVLNYINNNKKDKDYSIENIACSLQNKIAEILKDNIKRACNDQKINQLVFAGGVAANKRIREALKQVKNIEIFYPKMEYCTDNAVMIAASGYCLLRSKKELKLDITIGACARQKT